MQCYLCISQMEFFIQKSGYNLLRCPSCGLIRTDLGKPYGEFIREFYTTGYFQGDIAKSAYRNYQKDKPYIVKNMRMFLSAIQKRKQRGTLLDVGCAYGFFVELAIQHGFDAYGIDPSADAIEKADPKIRNRLTKGTSSEHMHKPAFFDVITMLDVFEHLGDPIGDLKKLRTLLKDDGILLIATGDTGSLAARILKRRWTFYIPPQHTFFFNKKNFTETLKQAGFAPFSFFPNRQVVVFVICVAFGQNNRRKQGRIGSPENSRAVRYRLVASLHPNGG